MSYNLPDDWGMYYSTCGDCGERFHASGCEECACWPCTTDDCDTIVNTKERNVCVECEEEETDIAL